VTPFWNLLENIYNDGHRCYFSQKQIQKPYIQVMLRPAEFINRINNKQENAMGQCTHIDCNHNPFQFVKHFILTCGRCKGQPFGSSIEQNAKNGEACRGYNCEDGKVDCLHNDNIFL